MEYGDGGGGGVTKKVVWVDSSCVLVAFNQCMRHAGSGYVFEYGSSHILE